MSGKEEGDSILTPETIKSLGHTPQIPGVAPFVDRSAGKKGTRGAAGMCAPELSAFMECMQRENFCVEACALEAHAWSQCMTGASKLQIKLFQDEVNRREKEDAEKKQHED
eukprot:TRINITY_DN98_c0_g2_i1.p1 TRINITY_DN98_c0_g2~~TRINITY_DN98_c0_g2_i1.p1  ORF type:complete len:111 (+),score=23.51 TRINITY_DN98_c0_g2_i1:95-427(+)